MKRYLTIMLFLSVLSLPSLLWAADPIIGTWKLNVSKSKYPPDEKPPKKLIEIYREIEGGLIDFTYDVIEGDGLKDLFKATWPAQGGIASDPKENFEKGRSYIETLFEPGNWYVTVLQNGKQIGVLHKVVSKNGKTLIQTFKGLNEQGKQIEWTRFYNRQ